MTGRHIILGVGVALLLSGASLFVWLLLQPSPEMRPAGPPPAPQILVASRDLPAGALLRADDMGWRAAAAEENPAALLVQGRFAQDEVVGAATRRRLANDEPIALSAVVRPTERAFLATILGPDMRAVSISLAEAGATATQVAPGDRVDVIMLQRFGAEVDPGHRSVGDTVLRGVRVIATDTLGAGVPRPSGSTGRAPTSVPTAEARARSVTLELSEGDAEKLLVSLELGKVEVVLRSAHPSQTADPAYSPTWASDVMPATKDIGGKAPGQPSAAARPIQVLRGSKMEQVCVDARSGAVSECTKAAQPP